MFLFKFFTFGYTGYKIGDVIWYRYNGINEDILCRLYAPSKYSSMFPFLRKLQIAISRENALCQHALLTKICQTIVSIFQLISSAKILMNLIAHDESSSRIFRIQLWNLLADNFYEIGDRHNHPMPSPESWWIYLLLLWENLFDSLNFYPY